MPLQLEPGDIIFTSDASVTSFLIKNRQGDFDYSHVCMAGEAGKIYTTGASGPPFFCFGKVDAQRYLNGKRYKVKRYQTLTSVQKTLLISAANSLVGKLYNFLGFFWLNLLALQGKVVSKLGRTRKFNFRFAVFCTQAVAFCYFKAGIILNPEAGKEDPTAYTLETIYYDPNLKTQSLSA